MGCHSELMEALGNNALPYPIVARWVGKFQKERMSTSDEQRLGRSVTHRTLPTFHPVTLISFPRLRSQYVVGGLQPERTLQMLYANRRPDSYMGQRMLRLMVFSASHIVTVAGD
ncbi:uncharacterized protein TNCV_4353711 [Trichonephila clavipes]|nr:uncharacterized protein TNCV_4353711 [Trichonephila clavipes]